MRIKAGRYTLEDRVLDGDGWSYWCGNDGLLRRPVGLLVVDPGHPFADDAVSAARASAAVEDTRVQRVLDVLTDDEGTCLVIEWTAGSTVEDLLADGPLADVESWRITLEVARALASAQARGLRHGALSPRWVLRGDGGRVRVLGLCIASALAGSGPDGPHPSEESCDVRGLGELLYAALTARWPGAAAECSLPAAPMQSGRPARPSRVRAGVPPALDDIAARALGLTTRGPQLAGAGDVVTALEAAGHRMRSFDASEPVALDAEQLSQLVDTGYIERVTAELVEDPRRSAAGARPRHRLALAGWLAALTAVALVVSGMWLVGRTGPAASGGPSSSPTPASSAAASGEPTGAVIPIVSVKDFDPPPGNGSENPDQVRFAWDNSLKTAWHTVTYLGRPDLGGLKPGVGLLVDLGSQQTVGAVRLHLVGRGTSVELRVGVQAGTVLDDFIVVAQVKDAGAVVTLRPDPAPQARYLLIWLTKLPLAPDGVDYSGGIADIEVHRS